MFDGKLDVHGRQDREDVRLQEGHEDLEARHDEHGGAGERGRRGQDGKLVEQNRRTEVGHAQQEVARDHVAQETQSQRDGADDKVRQELDGRDEQVHGHGQSGREELRGKETAHALLADTRTDEGHVRDEREDHRDGDDRRCRDVDSGDDARNVHGQDTEEQETDEAGELAAGLGAEHVEGYVVANVTGDRLDGHLASSGHQLGLTRDRDKNQRDKQPHDDAGESQSVELEERSLAENDVREEVLEGRLVGVLCERGVGGRSDDDEEDREAHPIPTRLGRGAASRRVIGH